MSQYLTSFLGFCSLVQLCFLPGYLVCRALKLRGRLETLLFSFALSMLINHLLVVGLVAAGWYQSNIMYGLFVAELGVLAVLGLTGRQRIESGGDPCFELTARAAGDSGDAFFLFGRHAAMVTIAVYVWLAWQNVGSVFTTWDAVGSWNPWGVSWAKGNIPHIWGTYPQLIPTSYSVTYVFMGNTQVQFFAKGMLGLFPIGALLAIYELGRRQRNAGIMFGVVIAGALQYYINTAKLENMMFSGYADVPVSFFAMMAFYCVLRAADERMVRSESATVGMRKFIWLGAFMCVTASVTKQTGMYMAAMYPVLLWGMVLRPAGVMLPGAVRQLVPVCVVMLLMTAPWYAYRAYMIRSGQSTDNFEELVVGLHREHTFAGRVRFALRKLRDALPYRHALNVLAVFHLAALYRRPYRWVYLLVIAPFMIIWAAAFSYSFRNLALVVPLMGMAAGVGLEQLLRAACWLGSPLVATGDGVIPRNGERQPVAAWGSMAIKLTILAVAVACFALPRQLLIERQAALQKEVGDPSLNHFLYEYHENRPVRGLISTHYAALNYLPGFEHQAIGLPMSSYETYENHRGRLGIEYFLVPSWLDPSYSPKIVEDIRLRIASREYKCIYDKNAWLYVRKMTPTDWMLDDALANAEAIVEAQQFEDAVALLGDMPLEQMEAPGRGHYLFAYSLHYAYKRSPVGGAPPTAALDHYVFAMKRGFSEFWSRYQRGLLLNLLERNDEALTELERAVDLEPNHRGAQDALSKVRQDLKDGSHSMAKNKSEATATSKKGS